MTPPISIHADIYPRSWERETWRKLSRKNLISSRVLISREGRALAGREDLARIGLKFYGSILKFLFRRIATSALLTKIIFGFRALPYPHPNCLNWDLSTLVLKKALDRYVEDGHRILEIGTGHLAILSIYISKRKHVEVTAADINPFFVMNAKQNAAKNNVDIQILQSNLFSNIHGVFDIIFFNPPCVPRKLENYLKLKRNLSIFDLGWDGGDNGCDTIVRFLRQVPSFIHDNTLVLLAVNTFYISDALISKLIYENQLRIVTVVSSMWNRSRVYIMANKAVKARNIH